MFRQLSMLVLLAGLVPVAVGAEAPRIAVVEMERVIRVHPRTESDRAVLEQYVADYDEERDEQLVRMRTLSETFEKLRAEMADPALSDRAREQKQEQARVKLEELRELERSIRETAQVRQRELTSQELRMRNRVVADIKRAVSAVASAQGLDFVFASDDTAATAFPAILHYPESADITDAVIAAIARPAEERP